MNVIAVLKWRTKKELTFLVSLLAKTFLFFSRSRIFTHSNNYNIAFIVAFFIYCFFNYVKSAAHLPEIPQETVNECKARLEENPSKDLFVDCTR